MTCTGGPPSCSFPRTRWSGALGGADPARTMVIVGPTAAGKTALAEALAPHLPLTVISADARQVYCGLDIGTAKPEPDVLRRVAHLGLDLVAVGERYSAGRFAADAAGWIEVVRLTGHALSHWQEVARETGEIRPWYIQLTLPRDVLHRRIAERVDRMLERGLVDEVRRVLATGVAPDAPGLDAVGYREVVAAERGELAWEAVRDTIVIATRQYAKRQETWFRHQLGRDVRHQTSDVRRDEVWSLDATEPPGVLAKRVLERWTATP